MSRVLRRAITLVLFLALSTAMLPSSAAAARGGWKYTALGDSLGTGIFASRGYVPRYQQHISTDTGVSVSLSNLSQNGWTSGDLLNALKTSRTFRRSVSGAHIVTWDIGGNDLRAARDSYKARTCGGADNQDCLKAAVATFEANWDGIIVEILALRTTSNTIIRTMDIYNPYVKRDMAADSWANDGDLNDFQAFKPYVDEVNRYIASTAKDNGISYAEVYLSFNGTDGNEDPGDKAYITFDGLHPNDAGHIEIASLLKELKYAPLRT